MKVYYFNVCERDAAALEKFLFFNGMRYNVARHHTIKQFRIQTDADGAHAVKLFLTFNNIYK